MEEIKTYEVQYCINLTDRHVIKGYCDKKEIEDFLDNYKSAILLRITDGLTAHFITRANIISISVAYTSKVQEDLTKTRSY